MRVPTSRADGDRAEGFTLMETLVTAALIAFLAAVVIPAVVQQAGAREPSATASLPQR